MRRTFNVAVSLTKNDYAEFELRPPINMVSGDHGTNILKFTVYDKGLPVDLSGNIAKITCKTPSGSRQQQDMTISSPKEGKMEVVLDQRFFTEGGTYLAEVQLYDPANLKVRATLPRFTYDVDTSLLEEHRVVANEQFSILQQMVDTVASAEERSVEALDTATRAMNIATQKGDKATEEANRAKNEADRAKNEADRAWAADFAKHVILNAKTQQNFNFIENKVIQDGLVFSKIEELFTGADNYINTNIEYKHDGIYDISFKLKLPNINQGSNRGIVGIRSMYEKYGWFINTLQTQHAKVSVIKNKQGEQYKVDTDFIQIFDEYISYRILIVKGLLTLYINDKLEIKDVDLRDIVLETDKKIYIGNTGQGMYIQNGYYKDILIYNHQLTPQEIQHNFSVLNNLPSIKELHTTDSEGKTSILNLASSEDHVEMSTGRTLREEYMGVLKTMGKEFTSADGSPIQVPNGIEARIINAEIKGQTVKNYAKTIERSSFSSVTGQTKIDDMNNIITIDTPTEYSNCFLKKGVELLPNTKYKVVLIILENTLSGAFSINNGAHSGTVFAGNFDLPKGSTGVKEFMFTTKSDVSGDIILRMFAGVGSGRIKLQAMVVEENATTPTSYIPFGLSSTQATISNNGQQFPIYASEEDKANKKVILLGGVGDVRDSLEVKEDGSGVFITNTKMDLFNGNEDWEFNSDNGTCIEFFLRIDIARLSMVLSDIFYSETQKVIDREYARVGTYLVVSILKSKLTTPDVDGFKQWLQANPVTVLYQLNTPQVTSIDKSMMPTIQTHINNTLEAGGAVKPSSFKVTVPIDQIATINAELEAIKAVLNSPSNLLLSAKYVEDEFNKNNKLESEMMN